MKIRRLFSVLFASALFLGACHSPYELVNVEGTVIPADSTWDKYHMDEVHNFLLPYRAKVDSSMQAVVGHSSMFMEGRAPESLLSNLVAGVLQNAATSVLGKPADVGVMNLGGLRSSLPEGTITLGDVFEILPFQNSLCVLTMKGSVLTNVMTDIARRGGEGISGARLVISDDGKLLEAKVGGKEIDPNKDYTLSTIDYLADGNDGMTSFLQVDKRECPADATLRGIFLKYLEEQEKQGKSVTSALDGRIIIRK